MTQYPPLKGAQLAWVTVALSLATFANVLDTSIANVAIPDISGSLAVSPDQGTWVITSFAVSNAIFLPLTGWLAKRFGEVRLFVWSTLLFTLASWLCGLAPNIGLLILFRVFQGAVAGPMIPLSQSLLLANYPNEKKNMAMAIWSMIVVVAPILGPISGGWITDNINWSWIFYINIPIGLAAAGLCWQILKHRETQRMQLPIDMIGLILLVIGIGSLQVMLDKGHDLDWFGSRQIQLLGLVSLISLLVLIIWEWTDEHPVLDLHLFRGRNFTIGVIATALGYMAYFASVVIFPLWLQTNMAYTATWAGLAAAPVGLLSIILTPFIGKNLHRIDARLLVSIAFAVFALVSFWSSTYDNNADYWTVMMPRLVQGIGMACFFVPLVTITLAGLKPQQIASAAGLSNFLRILGGSFGTSLSVSLWSDRATLHHAQLTAHINNGNPVSTGFIEQMQQALGISHQAALAAVDRTIQQQSVMIATDEMFWISGVLFLALLGLIWFAKPPFTAAGGGGGGAH